MRREKKLYEFLFLPKSPSQLQILTASDALIYIIQSAEFLQCYLVNIHFIPTSVL